MRRRPKSTGSPKGLKLLPHQAEGVRIMDAHQPHKRLGRRRGVMLLGDDVGLGKTAQAINWFFLRCPLRKTHKMLIVCPSTVKYNWQREVFDWFGVEAVVLEGSKPKRATMHLPSRAKVVILNYEIAAGWADNLLKHQWGLVVADEAQKMQNRDTVQTRAVRKIGMSIPYRMALTATPVPNAIINLWPTLNFLRPDVFPSYTQFGRRFTQVEQTRWGIKFKGGRNLPQLHRLLKRTVLLRRLKSDVLDLPPKTRHVVPIDLSPDGWREYREAEQDFVRWLKATRPDRADKARKNERLMRITYLRGLIGRLKRPGVMNWIEEFFRNGPRAKLIALGVHVEDMTKPLYEAYKDKYGAVLVNGSVTGRKREQMIQRFQHDKTCRLLVGNIRAAGAGWNGTQAADIAKCELDWTPSAHAQGEGRIDRIGQELDTRAHYLLVPKTIESMLMSIIQTKQELIDQAIDGGRQETAGGFTVFDQLEDMFLHQKKENG